MVAKKKKKIVKTLNFVILFENIWLVDPDGISIVENWRVQWKFLIPNLRKNRRTVEKKKKMII